jgi:hypothetical protein
MQNSRTVSEILEAKGRAEKSITKILNDLKDQTGLHISDINIKTLPIYHGIISVEAVIKISL